MLDLTYLTGLPFDHSDIIRLEGQRYRIGKSGERAIRLAVEIFHRIESRLSLMPLRDKIRLVRNSNCSAALAYVVQQSTHARMRLIAIWLRGLCGGYLGTGIVAGFARDKDERTRAAVAGALQRMSAWSVLDTMSTSDPSERVRRIASKRTRLDFSNRMQKFAENVSPLPVLEQEKPLYVSAGLDLQSRPVGPKPLKLIRQLLERIRELVHGGKIFPPNKFL